jgi:uncharacterized protein (TIGR03437 family)
MKELVAPNCRLSMRTVALGFGIICYVFGQTPSPKIAAVVNAASYAAPPIAPGEMIVIFGDSMGPSVLVHAQADSHGNLPTTLFGVQVLFDGTAAPLIYVSATQIAAMAPFGLSGHSATQVQVVFGSLASTPVTLQVSPAALGVFSADASGKGQAAMTNSNGSYNSSSNPAAPGSYVTFYMAGTGPTNPKGADGAIATGAVSLAQPISVQIGESRAQVLYAGAAPGNVDGFTQVNVVVPGSLAIGGNLPLLVELNGVQSQAGITLAVSGPPSPPSTVTTIFLIHGILQGDPDSASGVATSPSPAGDPPLGYLKSALQKLDAKQFEVNDGFNWGRCANSHVPSACPSDRTIEEGAKELSGYVIAAAPPGNIILVGYSMGGLLARDLIVNNYANAVGDRKVFLVTLGTPNIGYPHLDIDDALICPALGNQMASDFRSQQANNMVVESSYLLSLNNAWRASSFTAGPIQWLAVSGTFCHDPLRSFDALGNAGCPDSNPDNDGVVCDQSARFRLAGKNLPTSTLAASDFAHTKDQLASLIGGSLFQNCNWTTPGTPYALFEPPQNSDVLNAVVAFINATRIAQ